MTNVRTTTDHPIAIDAPTVLTLGDVARRLRRATQQVRRLYERGLLAEPRRLGIYRVVSVTDLPAIEAALEQAGYLADHPPMAVPVAGAADNR